MIGKRLFDSLQPFWVKQMKEWNACYWIYHVELEELRVALNNMWLNFSIHSEPQFKCSCEDVYQSGTIETNICIGFHATYLRLTTLWEYVVCPQDEFSKWHAKECWLGECENCAVDIFPIEEEGTSNCLVSWRHFFLETIVTKKGEDKNKLKLVGKVTSIREQ
jgi:hypothetical protein